MRAAIGIVAALIGGVVAAEATDDARVRVLAGTCANCHGTHGKAGPPMPSLAGLPAATIEARMREYREGRRPATVMHQIAKGFDDEQVSAIARHFAALPGERK